MTWSLEWGPHLKDLMGIAATGTIPKALQSMPLLLGHQGLYHRAFQVLSRFRQSGGMSGVSSLKFADIVAYADEYKITDEDMRDRLVHYVAEMDSAYISFFNTKGKSTPDWVRDKDTKPKL